MNPNQPQTLPAPSAKLKKRLDAELQLPKYEGMDEDLAIIDALQAISVEAEPLFDPLNSTDQILRRLCKDDN